MRATWISLFVVAVSSCATNAPLSNGADGSGGAGRGGADGGSTGGGATGGAGGATGGATGKPDGAAGGSAGAPEPPTCASTTDDEDNCGACGVRCGPTSTCVGGNCTSVVNVLPADLGCRSMDIAISDGTLYWTDMARGSVSSRPIAGGAAKTLASRETRPSHLAVAGGAVYWLSGTSTIRRLAGDALVDVVDAPAPIGGFVLSPDGNDVFFSSGTTVSRVPAAGGGAPTLVAQELKGELPVALALTGPGLLAFTTQPGGYVEVVSALPGQIGSCDADSQPQLSTCARVSYYMGMPNLVPDTLVGAPGVVFWLDGTYVKEARGVSSMPVYSDVIQVSTSDNVLTSLAMTATRVYYSDAGTIYSAPMVGYAYPTRLARGQNGARSLAVDATKVYWSTASCTVESTDL